MKPIERISMYLKFRSITPHSFEKKIILSNGYFSKQLRNLGSVGSDILIKIHETYEELNILWVLTGQGQMLQHPSQTREGQLQQADEFTMRFETENKKLKNLESDMEKLSVVIKDKEKIITLYEFMLTNNNNNQNTIADAI